MTAHLATEEQKREWAAEEAKVRRALMRPVYKLECSHATPEREDLSPCGEDECSCTFPLDAFGACTNPDRLPSCKTRLP